MTAPRQLLGWTVPEHIAVTEGEGNYYLRCENGHVGSSMTVSRFMRRDEHVLAFLQGHAHGETVERLPGVLPETPEPQAKIFAPWNSETALTLIDFQQVGHLHPFTCPRDHDGQFPLVANNGGWFCPADKCDYTQNWAWAFMADRSAWPDSPISIVPAPQSSPAPLLPLSAPVETEGQVEGVRGQLADHLVPIALAAGWTPPPCNCLPFDVCDTCWGPEQQRESQIRQLAYCEEIIPCGPEDADQCPNLREPGSVHCAQHQPSPLPADEVERPRRCPALVPEGNVVTEGRQCQQYEGHAHRHTWYGDNGSAYSAWEMTS